VLIMFGSAYPASGFDRMMSERQRDHGIADYVRLEFRPADQAAMWFTLRRAGRRDRRRKAGGFVRRFHSWRELSKAARKSASAPH